MSKSLLQPNPRPTGVTILAVLAAIAGIISLFIGILLLVAVAILASALLVANGVTDFVLAIGYMDGSGWAWMLAMIFGAVNIVGSIIEIAIGLSNNVLGIVISVITILYLTRPKVKAFFGRGPQIAPGGLSIESVLPMATRPAPTSPSIARRCVKCGDMISPGAGFCRTCGTVQ